MEITKQKEGSLFLHREIGRGTMPDGRKCRLLMTDGGVHMQVYPKGEKGKHTWDTYSLSWIKLGEEIVKEIKKIEKVS